MKMKELLNEIENKKIIKDLLGEVDKRRIVKKVSLFNTIEGYVISITGNRGLLLEDFEIVERNKENYLKRNDEVGAFFRTGEYKNYVIEIGDKKFFIKGIVSINYKRGKLRGFAGIFTSNKKTIFDYFRRVKKETFLRNIQNVKNEKIKEINKLLYNKFKNWMIEREIKDFLGENITQIEFNLLNLETREKAEVFIIISNDYLKYVYRIYDKNGNLIEQKEESFN